MAEHRLSGDFQLVTTDLISSFSSGGAEREVGANGHTAIGTEHKENFVSNAAAAENTTSGKKRNTKKNPKQYPEPF